tara:strand:+ start:35 stop:316 length:282 start_codon:yes stop_codon:yes gene_type:complete
MNVDKFDKIDREFDNSWSEKKKNAWYNKYSTAKINLPAKEMSKKEWKEIQKLTKEEEEKRKAKRSGRGMILILIIVAIFLTIALLNSDFIDSL